jgi:hypothetical protein
MSRCYSIVPSIHVCNNVCGPRVSTVSVTHYLSTLPPNLSEDFPRSLTLGVIYEMMTKANAAAEQRHVDPRITLFYITVGASSSVLQIPET